MIDTGSNIACITSNLVSQLKIPLISEINSAAGFSNDSKQSSKICKVSLNFGPFTLQNVKCIVYDNLAHPIILPSDLFNTISINYPTNSYPYTIKLNGHTVRAVTKSSFSIKTPYEYTVPAESTMVYKLDDLKLPSGMEFKCHPHSETIKLGELKVLSVLCVDDAYLIVENHSPYEHVIPKSFPILQVTPDLQANVLIKMSDEKAERERLEHHNQWRKDNFAPHKQNVSIPFGDFITKDQRVILNEILNKYNICFSAAKYDIGQVAGFRYGIKLKPGTKPWFQSPRRIAPRAQPEISKIFQQEIKYKLISESSSEYNIPLVLVRKPSNEYRICLDMRQANLGICMDRYPIPSMHNIFDSISAAITNADTDSEIYITKLDLSSAYRQLEIAEKDKSKISFSYNGVMYQNERMNFGASDSPGTWCQLMNICFKSIPNCWLYLDDALYVSVGFKALVADTEKMLSVCKQYGLTLGASKCVIGTDGVDMLGYHVSRTGISLIKNKVDKVLELKRPTSKDNVRSVVAGFNYYRTFSPNMILTLAPLFRLLKKSVPFNWSQECEQAFTDAKNLLANYVTKNHRNNSLPLVLVCDASLRGCGAALHQRLADGKLQPLGFFSRIFSETEQRAPIRNRELFSIFYGIKNWESILLTEEFYIHSDHRSLEFYRRTKTNQLSTRAINIINYINRFDAKIIYLPGSDPRIAPADMLSRAPFFTEKPISEENDTLDTDDHHVFQLNVTLKEFPFTLRHYSEAQLVDEKLSKKLENPQKPFLVKDGLLCKTIKDVDVICLPEHLIQELVAFTHFRKGHLSGPKIHRHLRMNFAGPNLRKHCLAVAKTCNDCIAVRHVPTLPTYGPKLPDFDDEPMSKIFIDLVDFGQPDCNNNRYALTYQCSLTRFLGLEPLPNKKQETVCQALIKLMCRFGVPNRVVSDRGKEFFCDLTRNLFDTFNVYVSHISPLRPQGNLVERCHRSLSELLKMHAIPSETWSTHIWYIVFLYNQTELDILNSLCPFEALYLRRPRSPVEFIVKKKLNAKWLEVAGEKAECVFDSIAKLHMHRFLATKVALQEQPAILKRNQLCLIFKPQMKGTSKKLSRKWSGPYRVVKRTVSDVYLLKHETTSKRIKRHISMIRIIPEDDQKLKSPNYLPNTLNSDLALTSGAPLGPMQSVAKPSSMQSLAEPSTVPSHASPVPTCSPGQTQLLDNVSGGVEMDVPSAVTPTPCGVVPPTVTVPIETTLADNLSLPNLDNVPTPDTTSQSLSKQPDIPQRPQRLRQQPKRFDNYEVSHIDNTRYISKLTISLK